MKYSFTPKGICTRRIDFEVDDAGVITACQFLGGCPGNTQGVARLVVGRRAEEVAQLLRGVACRRNEEGVTSCPDQLARALSDALAARSLKV